jgi:hypothetical protein
MAVFGNENLQTSTVSIENQIIGGVFSPASSGTADSIDCYMDFGGLWNLSVKCGLYKWNSGTSVWDFVKETETWTVGFGEDVDGWHTFNFTGTKPIVSSGVNYILCAWSEDAARSALNVRVNPGFAGNKVLADSLATYGTFPDPFSIDTTLANYIMSIHCNYTPSAAGTNMQINIGDTFKSIAGMQINIGDVWKTVAGAQINIGDVWKTIF